MMRIGEPLSRSLRAPDLLDAMGRVLSGGVAEKTSWSEKAPVERWFEAHIAPLKLADQETAALISVRDHGPGIDQSHIPRLTERFYRVDTGKSRAKGGTGLGLAIVKHIALRHRGRLLIESRVGDGSIFKVILPAIDSDWQYSE